MTNKFRTISIFVLISSFFLITPILVLHSQGYRFDFNPPSGGIKITQTGGLFVKVFPKNADVFLDGKIEEKTSFFFGSVYIDNLLPKKYNIRVEKNDYNIWEKNLEIKEKQVAEAKNITLIPKNLEIKTLTKKVENFWVLSQEKLIFEESASAFAKASADEKATTDEDEWALKIFDLENNLKNHLISEKEISKKESELLKLNISSDNKKILLKLGLKEQLQYYILDLEQSPPEIIPLDFLESDAERVDFHPQELNIIFYFKDGNLFEVDLLKHIENNSRCVLEEILTYKILDNNIYYINQRGYIFKNNLSFDSEEKINIVPFSLKKETKYELKVENSLIFILENQSLFLFNSKDKNFEKIFEPVKEIKLSPDGKKILYFNEHEIWILFLEKQEKQPKKEAMTKQFLSRFSEKINDVSWFNSHYLIFDLESKIRVMEIDDRDKINNYELCSEIKKFTWGNEFKQLYILTKKNVLNFIPLSSF